MKARDWWSRPPFAVAASVLFALGVLPSMPLAAEPARRALLIGINEYASPAVPDLRGAGADVAMMRRVLTRQFGFAEDDIITLTDAQATRAAILRAIDALVAASGEDDIVYLHFSGHGSQVKDSSGDEEDGLDETILPHDARLPGVTDIVDDELYPRLSRLKAGRALLVFDSCHSGTITRVARNEGSTGAASAGGLQPRFVPRDERTALYRTRAAETRDIAAAADATPHVVMSGAPAHEETLDGPVDDGWYGLFSWSLARALESTGPAASATTVHAAARRELAQLGRRLNTRTPEPQLEGAPERIERPPLAAAAASGAAEAPRRTWLEVEPLGGARLRLIGGLELNARPGSQWAVYPAGETRFLFGQALAVGTVERLSGQDAILAVGFGAQQVPRAARAVALAAPAAHEELPVRFEGLAGAQRAELEHALRQRVHALRVANPGEYARFVVLHESGTWRVLDAGGLQEVLVLPGAAAEQVIDTLARTFSSAVRAAALLALDNPSSDVRVEVRLVRAGGSASSADAVVPVFDMRAAGEPRSAANSLMLEIATNVDAYLTVASVDTEGRINLLFPNDYQNRNFLRDGFAPQGTAVRIPDSLAAGNRAGFYWDYGPPAGRDTIRVFAATDLETAHTIREFIRRGASEPAQLGALRTSLASRAVRGIQVVASELPARIEGWAAASLVIEVRP